MKNLPKTERLSYLWATLAVVIASCVRLAVRTSVSDEYAFWFFIPAVVIGAWCGGVMPGLIALLLSAVAGVVLIEAFPGPHPDERVGAILFAVSSLSILLSVHVLRKSLRHEIVSRPAEPLQEPARREVEIRDRAFKSIFDNTLDIAIITLDANRFIREWNVGATQLTGWSRGEMIGKSADVLFTAEDLQKNEPSHEQLLAEATGKNAFSRRFRRRDGSEFIAEGTVRSMPGAIGEQPGFIKVFADVTSRVQRHEETIEQMLARTQDASELTYTMAHDMRQYTRGISTNTTFIVRELGEVLSDDQKFYLERLKDNAQRMHSMVEGILDHLRLGRSPGDLRPVNLSALGDEAANSVRNTPAGSSTQFIIQPGMWVKGDREMLSCVICNLLENAAKYAPGRVVFGRDSAKQAYYVRDEGPGFDANKYSDKIFKLFERLHGQDVPGTGIGLANVKRIVERHGGTVWVESEIGKGSTFYFTLKSAVDEPVGALR